METLGQAMLVSSDDVSQNGSENVLDPGSLTHRSAKAPVSCQLTGDGDAAEATHG